MRKILLDHFQFSRAERLGVLSLAFLNLVFWMLPTAFQRLRPAQQTTDFHEFEQQIAAFQAGFSQPDFQKTAAADLFLFDPNTATFDDFTRLGLDERIANRILNYREKGGQFRQPHDFQKIYGLAAADFERLRPFISLERAASQPLTEGGSRQKTAAATFPFDPNDASENDFLRLGLEPRVARSILNYREKGGIFRKKGDFSKIYNLPPADFERLEPFIQLPESSEKLAWLGPVAYSEPTNSRLFSEEKKQADFGPIKIDINRAGLEDWKRLPGVGDFFAKKIIDLREKLGGFSGLEQVAQTRGLPDSSFQKMRPWLLNESPIFRKINLNTATADQLKTHPYFERRLAEAIVAYREHHGPFKKLDDLRAVRAIPANWFELIFPYLTVN